MEIKIKTYKIPCKWDSELKGLKISQELSQKEEVAVETKEISVEDLQKVSIEVSEENTNSKNILESLLEATPNQDNFILLKFIE